MLVIAALAAGVLAASGTWLVLQRNLVRVALGFIMISNAANLFLICSAGDPGRRVEPIVTVNASGVIAGPSSGYVDPLPQALILTAIVISFAVTAFQVALAYRLHREGAGIIADAQRAEDAA